MPDAGLKAADSYYNLQEYSKAIEVYQEMRTSFPQTKYERDALYGLSWCYSRLGDNEQAAEISKLFLKKFPKEEFSEEIQFKLASYYFNSKK